MFTTTTLGRAIRSVTNFRRPGKPASKVCPVCHTLECLCRPRYFAGQLLTDDDLNAEQEYVIKKNQLHNLYLHGWGVVCGLRVLCHDTCSGWITVEPGYAISPCGDDIVVCEATDFDVLGAIDDCLRRRAHDNPMDCSPRASVRSDCDPDGVWCLTIRYQETASRAVTSLRSGTEGGTKACSCGPPSTCGGGCSCGGSNGKAGKTTGHGGGGGCHCGGKSSHGATSVGCGGGCGSGATSSVATGPAKPQCEPTRWCEGYVLELCQQDPGSDRPTYGDVLGGTLFGNLYQCFSDVAALLRKPDPHASAAVNHQALVTMQADVLRFMMAHHTARCDLLDEVRGAGGEEGEAGGATAPGVTQPVDGDHAQPGAPIVAPVVTLAGQACTAADLAPRLAKRRAGGQCSPPQVSGGGGIAGCDDAIGIAMDQDQGRRRKPPQQVADPVQIGAPPALHRLSGLQGRDCAPRCGAGMAADRGEALRMVQRQRQGHRPAGRQPQRKERPGHPGMFRHRVIDDGHQDLGFDADPRVAAEPVPAALGIGLLGLLGHQYRKAAGFGGGRRAGHRREGRRILGAAVQQKQQRQGLADAPAGRDEQAVTPHRQRPESPAPLVPATAGHRLRRVGRGCDGVQHPSGILGQLVAGRDPLLRRSLADACGLAHAGTGHLEKRGKQR